MIGWFFFVLFVYGILSVVNEDVYFWMGIDGLEFIYIVDNFFVYYMLYMSKYFINE